MVPAAPVRTSAFPGPAEPDLWVAAPTAQGVLFRTRVTVRTPADWRRLEWLGVMVLRTADQGESADSLSAQSAASRTSVVILANEDQLETLARLRFEPRGTDELGMLVTAHARAKPWLAASLQPLLNEAAALGAEVQRSQGTKGQGPNTYSCGRPRKEGGR